MAYYAYSSNNRSSVLVRGKLLLNKKLSQTHVPFEIKISTLSFITPTRISFGMFVPNSFLLIEIYNTKSSFKT